MAIEEILVEPFEHAEIIVIEIVIVVNDLHMNENEISVV